MYTFDSRIRYSEVDSEGNLTLNALLNYFQDVTTFHSEALELGIDYMNENQIIWVLVSWQIVVERMPKLGEWVSVGTLPYDFKGFMGFRNFIMTDENGNCLAKANTIWTLLDLQTEKPAALTQKMIEGYALEPRIDMEYAPRRIKVFDAMAAKEEIVIKKQHLDTNKHVNNGQYVNMAMEYLPEDFEIGQMRAEYKKQARLEDILYPRVCEDHGKWIILFANKEQEPFACIEFSGK